MTVLCTCDVWTTCYHDSPMYMWRMSHALPWQSYVHVTYEPPVIIQSYVHVTYEPPVTMTVLCTCDVWATRYQDSPMYMWRMSHALSFSPMYIWRMNHLLPWQSYVHVTYEPRVIIQSYVHVTYEPPVTIIVLCTCDVWATRYHDSPMYMWRMSHALSFSPMYMWRMNHLLP